MDVVEKRRGRYFCGHCKTHLSKTVFFRHKRLFYDRKAKRWSRRRVVDEVLVTAASEPFTLSSDSEEDTVGLTGEHHHRVHVIQQYCINCLNRTFD